jgi:hypothetical protein
MGKVIPMKTILLIAAATLLALAIPLPAEASLGGDITTVHADQARLQGTLAAAKNSAYTIETITLPTGVSVHEYISTTGQVFAVSWKGRTRPSLQQLLGSYFPTFKQALQAQQKTTRTRGPLVVKQAGLVVEIAGHMGALVGRAYVPGMVPSNIQLEEIR